MSNAREAGAAVVVALLLGAGCGENLEPFVSSESREHVINEDDDRRQWFELASAGARATLSAGVAALMWTHHLDPEQGGLLRAVTLEQAAGVCADEPFAGEPSAAWCSGALIDDELVLTAGHCVGRDAANVDESCRQLRVVFDYHYARPGELALDAAEDVYSCRRVAHYEYGASGAGSRDVAILQLDRAVSAERQPVPLAKMRVRVGDALVAATHGAGLPLKVDAGGVVTELPAGGQHFVASTDSFSGGSGGPVFDSALELVAHQVRGLRDWARDGDCMRRARAERPAEQHQWAERSVAALCERDWPSERLCGRAALCGDGICNAAENGRCAEDCAPASCGDGFCEGDEPGACARDCAPYADVPPAWLDAPASYAAPQVESAGGPSHGTEPEGGCNLARARASSRFGMGAVGLALCGAIRRRRSRPPR